MTERANFYFIMACDCSVQPDATPDNCAVAIEHRNAANTANVADALVGEHSHSMIIAQGTGTGGAVVVGGAFWPKVVDDQIGLAIATNERIRVRILATFTGQIFCSMFYR